MALHAVDDHLEFRSAPDQNEMAAMMAQAQHNEQQAQQMAVQAAQMQGTFQAIAMVLTARLMVLLALIGGFVLSAISVYTGDWRSMLASALFDILVFIPLLLRRT